MVKFRRKVYDFLEMGSFASPAAGAFERFMVILIVANVTVVALESVPSLWSEYRAVFYYFELFSICIFSVEYIARVWASVEREPDSADQTWISRLKYMATPLALVDLAAILPFYMFALTATDLRFLRIFRLIRLFKLVRYSPAIGTLSRVVYAERRALLAALVVMLGLMFFAASLMHFIEGEVQPDAYGSIPAALWWALATLTTVGYGDVVPITTAGKIVGGLFMVFGLAFYALPIGIIASGFSDEIHRREFVVPSSVLLGTGLFTGLPVEVIHDLGVRMRTLEVTVGTVLTHRQDEENGLYIIISGEVSTYFHQRVIPMGAGDFFGEMSMISDEGREATVIARTKCRLLWLENPDLHMSLSLYPDIASRMLAVAKDRLASMVEAGHLSFSENDELYATLQSRLPVNLTSSP